MAHVLKKYLLIGAAVATSLVCLPPPSYAAEMPVPIALQAALLRKIMTYDSVLGPKGNAVKILIVCPQPSAATSELRDSFAKLGAQGIVLREGELAGSNAEAHAVYIMPGVATGPVSAYAEEKQLLSMSGQPDLAERGDVAVGLGKTADEKPLIIVNLARLGKEKHQFPSSFLSLAKVVR